MTDSKKPIAPLTMLKGVNYGAFRPADPPPDDDNRELLSRAYQRLASITGADKARELLGERLQSGEARTFMFIPGHGHAFTPENAWPVSEATLKRRLETARAAFQSSTVARWLFIERAVVDQLLLRRQELRSAPFMYQMDRSRWPLFDACVWVGAGGVETTTGSIAADNLAEKGSALLFEALADQPVFGGVYVYGLGEHIQTRMQVEPGSWDAAHLGEHDFGPMITITPRLARGTGDEYVSADFHKSKRAGPWMRDLWIRRDELFSLFPSIAAGMSGSVAPSVQRAEPVTKPTLPDLPAVIVPAPAAAPDILAPPKPAAPPFNPSQIAPEVTAPTVRALIATIWEKWGGLPPEELKHDDMARAVWASLREKRPELPPTPPSRDSFDRAKKAIRDHLNTSASAAAAE